MSNKTNIKTTSVSDALGKSAAKIGFVLMSGAAILGMVHLPEHRDTKIITPMQPVFATVSDTFGNEQNAMRRERDEVHPHFISYSATQRTPGRTGRL